jgi:4-hydroxy-3-methylbut-2-en-1-yl diphosphate synthase IspG/GcpE
VSSTGVSAAGWAWNAAGRSARAAALLLSEGLSGTVGASLSAESGASVPCAGSAVSLLLFAKASLDKCFLSGSSLCSKRGSAEVTGHYSASSQLTHVST